MVEPPLSAASKQQPAQPQYRADGGRSLGVARGDELDPTAVQVLDYDRIHPAQVGKCPASISVSTVIRHAPVCLGESFCAAELRLRAGVDRPVRLVALVPLTAR